MPQPESLLLKASDGRKLSAWKFEPDGTARATVLVMGAYAVRQRYYRRFAEWLSVQGFRVLTFDTRGIGESLQGRVQDEPIDASGWAHLDHGAALAWVAEQPGPKLAVAHSFGGQVLGIHEGAACLDGMYAVAAQLGYWGYYEGLERYRMRFLFSVVMPGLTRLFGYLPGWTGIGEDVPPNAMLEWTRWLRSPNYLVDHVPGASAHFRAWPGQYVGVGFTDDTYAPPAGVLALAQHLEPSRTQVRILKPADVGLKSVGHFGFFRAHSDEVLWKDALSHLNRWTAG